MFIRIVRERAIMLKFPNLSRSFNAATKSVRFGGYDTVFEVTFELEAAALARMDGRDTQDEEAALLSVFDDNRARIERVARAVYAKQKSRFVRLEASHF